MRLVHIGCVSALVALSACKTHHFGESKVKSSEIKPSPQCDGKPMVDFMVMPDNERYDAASFDWPPMPANFKRVAQPTSTENSVHLQLCLSDDYTQVVKLLRAEMRLKVKEGRTVLRTIVPSSPPKMKGVTEPLFGDYSNLEIEAENSREESQFFMKGWKNGDKPVVSAEIRNKEELCLLGC